MSLYDLKRPSILTCHCRYPGSAAIALVEASVLVKDGNLSSAHQVLTGLQSDSPVTSLQALLMRAQMAVYNDNQTEVRRYCCLCRVFCDLSGLCAMLCYAVLCCAVLCCAVLCCAVLCCAVVWLAGCSLTRLVSGWAVQCCAAQHCAVLCCAVL